jgi:SAM-dependent methyltransferase
MRGLEFGPLTQPIVDADDGPIEYVDYLPTDALRAKYESDPNVDAAGIAPVHVVLERGRLPAAALQGEYDYIVASHVFEHLPDPIGWLQQCAGALRAGGLLCLALPDKRYTWDILRPVTRLGDWVEGYCLAPDRPTLRQVFDATSTTALMPNGTPWHRPPSRAELQPERELPEAFALARQALDVHIDVHCSVFTPVAWLRLLADTHRLGLCPFELAWFHDTRPGEIEFFAGLRNGPVGEPASAGHAFDETADALAEAPAHPQKRFGRRRRWLGGTRVDPRD